MGPNSSVTNVAGTPILKIGHGLMMMTWIPTPVDDETCFEAIKAGIESAPVGVKVFINSGEFYGISPREANLMLLGRFFSKYPELADRVFLSVKGGSKADNLISDSSEENLRRSVDCINTLLGGKKRLDLFECARVDHNYPIEETIQTLAKLVKEGKFDHIGLSECSASTLRRASKIHKIAATEIEVSLWSYEEETKKVIAAAKELDVLVVAYCPLGRGFLTGQVKAENLEDGDVRKNSSRFNSANDEFVAGIAKIAAAKNVTAAQLCIAWVGSLGEHVVPIPGSSHASRTLENFRAGDIQLSNADISSIEELLEKVPVQGDRYDGPLAAHNWG